MQQLYQNRFSLQPTRKTSTAALNDFAILPIEQAAAWRIDTPQSFKACENINLVQPNRPTPEEYEILNWVVTFFLLAVMAALFGFGGLAGAFTETAQCIAVVFVSLFVASLVYTARLWVAAQKRRHRETQAFTAKVSVNNPPPSSLLVT